MTFIDVSDPDYQQELGSLVKSMNAPDGIKAAVSQKIGSEGAIFFVLMDRTSDFVTDINIHGCDKMKESAAIGATLVEAYKQANITASIVDKAVYLGNSIDIVKAELLPGVDTYQSLNRVSDCYAYTTLSTVKGDKAPLADFKIFLAFLRITSVRK